MSNAPRVTPEDVAKAILSETYTLLPNGRTTVCQLTLDNGFTVEGQSACVSVENYNEELGNKIARENAVSEVWKLLGFRLADKLTAPVKPADSFLDRIKIEEAALREKLNALTQFLAKPTATIDAVQHDLLVKQHAAMLVYAEILNERLALLGSKD